MNEIFYDIFSPSGCEDKMCEYIKERINGIFDEVKKDAFGNLIARAGDGEVCIECSMDSLGIMIVSLDDGTARFSGVGGISAEYLIGKKILFKDGNIGIVRYDGKNPSESKIKDLYLECDTHMLEIGDFGVVKSGYCETNDKIFANGLGNKIGLSAVLSALDEVKKANNLCVLFSAQKRLGARGIQAFLGCNEFNKVLTVEGVSTSKIKSGCSLVVADKAGVCNKEYKNQLMTIMDVPLAVTDENLCMGNIITSGHGAHCAALAISVSHKDNNFECVKKEDFKKAVCEIVKFVKSMDKSDL